MKLHHWAAIIVFIFMCVPIPSPAETQGQGPGTAELSDLSAARKALAETEKALLDAKAKTPAATEAEITKAKLDVDIAKLKLGAAEERARTVLGTIPSPAETPGQGQGIAELSNLSTARKALAEAEKTLLDAKAKTPAATEAEITKAKLDVDIAKLKLGAAEEQARTVLGTIGSSLPVKDSPVSQDKCYMARPLFGDLAPLGLENWSVGTTIATSVVRYDFSSKKAALATGAGAGIAIRYYGKSLLGTKEEAKRLGYSDETIATIKKHFPDYVDDAKDKVSLPLASIKPECRATTSDIGKERSQKLASSLFSITPIVYYSKQTTETDLNIQPAIMLGVLDDIISIGTGFNLTGQEKGKMFLLLSLGYGFKF